MFALLVRKPLCVSPYKKGSDFAKLSNCSSFSKCMAAFFSCIDHCPQTVGETSFRFPFVCHLSFVIKVVCQECHERLCHLSFVICHLSLRPSVRNVTNVFVICHLSFVIKVVFYLLFVMKTMNEQSLLLVLLFFSIYRLIYI